MLENVARTGGHLSSNLGTVELTVALHYVFNTPDDVVAGRDAQLEAAIQRMLKDLPPKAK